MTIQEFRVFHQLSQEALKITAEINGKYHTPKDFFSVRLVMPMAPVGQTSRQR